MKFSRTSATLALAGAILSADLPVYAELKLAAIFGDNMVLQQDRPVPVWGWSAPGAEVTVKFAGQTRTTQARANGKWIVRLDALKASNLPEELSVESCATTKTFTNILVGEVWLCSGQSNMEKSIGLQPGQKPCFNYQNELATANYPNLRLFKIGKVLSETPLTDLKTKSGWLVCNSNSLEKISFSAAAYFFGREIHTNLNVPVGLIEAAWGGTRIEPWISPVGFTTVPSLATPAPPELGTDVVLNPRIAGPNIGAVVIYNAMIAPITGFSIRGVIWYQGESNCLGENDETYADKMAALVGGWRMLWDEGDFPFYFVQIAPFRYTKAKPPRLSPEILPEFWATQSRAARRIKNTGMVVTTDLVDNLNDIHPRNKQDVGHRLALLARNRTYGEKNVVCSGPTFCRIEIYGHKAVLYFDNAYGGLVSKGGRPLTWFAVAGKDGKFVPADARISNNSVEVFAEGIEHPAMVRFAWDETAQPNLYNASGLPAEPFRTDQPLN